MVRATVRSASTLDRVRRNAETKPAKPATPSASPTTLRKENWSRTGRTAADSELDGVAHRLELFETRSAPL